MWLSHERLWYNYRLDEMSSVLGVVQMGRIEEIIEKSHAKEGDFPVTEEAGRTSIAMPFHNRVSAEEIDYVAEALEKVLADRPRG